MYQIKRAVELTGVSAGTLRAWEQRYGVGSPRRTESGYRLYDDEAITEIRAMQALVASGWTHAEAAAEVERRRSGIAAAATPPADGRLGDAFLEAARALDEERLNAVLDDAFSRGSFEHVVDGWLMTTLRQLGEEWLAGRMDIAGEHFASGAIMRRLGAAFDGAASMSGRDKVLIGTPPGSLHEMGSLALAAAARRRGVGTVYLGSNVPTATWVDAVQRHGARGVVISTVTTQDVSTAQEVVDALTSACPDLLVAVGGAVAPKVTGADLVLAGGIGDSARALAAAVQRHTR